jgi:hypothetical protein
LFTLCCRAEVLHAELWVRIFMKFSLMLWFKRLYRVWLHVLNNWWQN